MRESSGGDQNIITIMQLKNNISRESEDAKAAKADLILAFTFFGEIGFASLKMFFECSCS